MTAKEELAQERAELQQALAAAIVEGMDIDTLTTLAMDSLQSAYSELKYSDLLNEVREFAPHLLCEPEDNRSAPADWFTV